MSSWGSIRKLFSLVDWATGAIATTAGALMVGIGASIWSDWGPIGVLIATLIAGAAIAVFYVAACIFWDQWEKRRGIPIAVSKVNHSWFGNYAGFFADNHEQDSQITSFGTITITNTSADRRVALDLFLQITGKDKSNKTNIRMAADLRNAWGHIYGRDDKAAKSLKDRSPDNFFQNPVEIKPGEISRKELVFLFNFGASKIRNEITSIHMKSDEYSFDLIINDLISGRSITIHIPGEYRVN